MDGALCFVSIRLVLASICVSLHPPFAFVAQSHRVSMAPQRLTNAAFSGIHSAVGRYRVLLVTVRWAQPLRETILIAILLPCSSTTPPFCSLVQDWARVNPNPEGTFKHMYFQYCEGWVSDHKNTAVCHDNKPS